MDNAIRNSLRSQARLTGGGEALSRQGRDRAEKLAEKRALRRQALKTRRRIPFSELSGNPLFRRIAGAVCPEDLKQELAAFRFENVAQVAAFQSIHALRDEVSSRSAGAEGGAAPSPKFLARAKREARRCYRLMRHAIAAKEPMSQGLRHGGAAFSAPLEAALAGAGGQSFARPGSLQSSQSPAAYLRHLYRIATGLDREIGMAQPGAGPYRLEARRPDLARLVLSETNLKQQLPTIRLVNEVLEEGLGDIDMRTAFHPIALPFDRPARLARAALARNGGASLNAVFARTARDIFPLGDDFRLARDEAGLLGLTGAPGQSAAAGSEVALITEADDTAADNHPRTFEDLYDAEDDGSAAGVHTLMSKLDLGFDDLVQLLGLYAVHQENGEPAVPKAFASVLLNNDAPPKIVPPEQGAGDGAPGKQIHLNGAPLQAPELRSLHYMARLHHATGLAFHHLSWLLAVPGASEAAAPGADRDGTAARHVTSTGLRLLAGYPLYREAFGLDPEAYAALFGEVCPFWRADTLAEKEADSAEEVPVGLEQTEVSFLRQLFGEEAEWLHTTLSDDTVATPVTDPDLAKVICRGLRLSAIELGALVSELEPGFAMTTRLDLRGLGALYRLTTVFRMLDWPLLTALKFFTGNGKKGPGRDALWRPLTARNETPAETDALLSAIDRLVGLAKWMRDAELAPEGLLAVLTPVSQDPADLEARDLDSVDRDWLSALALAVEASLVGSGTFRGFDTWELPEETTVVIPGEEWASHLTGETGICHPSGVFRPDMDREAIAAACRVLLTTHEVDPDDADNTARLERLVTRLEKVRDTQAQTLERHLATLAGDLTALGARGLITWSQTTTLAALEDLLAGAETAQTRFRLLDLRRHLMAVEALGLGDIDMVLIGDTPAWLYAGAADLAASPPRPKPLDLEQLFHFHRFTALQVGVASDAAWYGYLAMIQGGIPNWEGDSADDGGDERTLQQEASFETVAILLGCPSEDVALYAEDLFGAGAVLGDIAGIDAVARHVRLAEELCLGAPELLALKRAGTSSARGDWEAAAAAAQVGLARFQGGAQVPGFEDDLAEAERDALVAAYMQTKIAADDELAKAITDREALYRYLLLDVSVTSAVPTSRMVEATSSLQLYINRVLEGLEPAGTEESRARLAAQWEIDRQYRLWEANQKLLLYPQNYIEPELRYITSPEFDDLMQSVSGNTLTEDSVEAAVNAYMAGLASCCDLSMCSFHADRRTDGDGLEVITYHMLAKAKAEPGRFFYRKLDADFPTISTLADPLLYLKAMDWTYWQDVSIPLTFELLSDVSVCVFKNRFIFFWVELEEQKSHSPEGEKITWRLHPRYMRCDADALSGTMRTPGLATNGALDRSALEVSTGEAFDWPGEKPVLNGTYHPTRVPSGQTPGQLIATDGHKGLPADTLAVTFGVDLTGPGMSENGDGTLAEDGTTRTWHTSLHIRVSDEWSDAILDLAGGLATVFEKESPAGYAAIHPRLAVEHTAMADEYVQTSRPKVAGVSGDYIAKHPDLPNVYNRYGEGTALAGVTFIPDLLDSPSLGSVDLEFDWGQRLYSFINGDDRMIDTASEWPGTDVRMGGILKFTLPGAKTRTFERWFGYRLTAGFLQHDIRMTSLSHHGVWSTEIPHPTDETFRSTLRLPEDWSFADAETAELTVTAKLGRFFPDLRVIIGKAVEYIQPAEREVEVEVDLATFVLARAINSKTHAAWAQTGEHGSRNFLQVFDNENRTIADSYVLSNFSTVLSKLARSMPRPGGCESLFQPANQTGQEDFGTFLADLPAALAAIYETDRTVLNRDRLPGDSFNFDSAYGAYGWEVFYHIPAAIAAGYAGGGQHDEALRWLRKIFDPATNQPWRVLPLIDAGAPENGLAFDTGDVFVDPDRIAADHPFYYRQATLRQTLEVMIAAGDAAYEGQTQETLQDAKAIYVSARQLFQDNLSETLEVLTNEAWANPTLAEASADTFDGFLPPWNQELRDLHELIEARLDSLRHWRDLNGEPLNVPLLAAPVDPLQLQKAGKAALRLASTDVEEEDETGPLDPLVDFVTVARSAKGYIANLKTTSARLLAAREKVDAARIGALQKDIQEDQFDRSLAVLDLTIEGSHRNIDIKKANLAAAIDALAFHLSTILVYYGRLQLTQVGEAVLTKVSQLLYKYKGIYFSISVRLKSKIPTIFGMANGGQDFTGSDTAQLLNQISSQIAKMNEKLTQNKVNEAAQKLLEQFAKVGDLSSKVKVARFELRKAEKDWSVETLKRQNLAQDKEDMLSLRRAAKDSFANRDFYEWLVADLELLYAEEWSTTQDFCRMLVRLYEDETCETNGASFLKPRSLGDARAQLNAPYRLELDVERLEAAYFRSLIEQQSQSASARISLNDVPALGTDTPARTVLLEQGEVYFELTDEMFDAIYPGQYDRRIQSLSVRFPGLAKAGLDPHGRLTQIANTRYPTPERDVRRGGIARRNRYALQSLMLGAPETDTAAFSYPDGMLKRFQNTGVSSRWHLVLPSVKELKRPSGASRGKAWREAATRHCDTLEEHLDDIVFEVRFSGRWNQ